MERDRVKEVIAQQPRLFYCSQCGTKLSYLHDGEQERPYCDNCQIYIYENPAVGVAAVLFNEEGHILLGRRKIGRKKGMWCIPCGYVDCHEDVREAAVRELKEETNLDIEVESLLHVRSNFFPPAKHAVGIWFMARHVGGELRARDDLEEVGYFHLDHLPEMAFQGDLEVIEKIKAKGIL